MAKDSLIQVQQGGKVLTFKTDPKVGPKGKSTITQPEDLKVAPEAAEKITVPKKADKKKPEKPAKAAKDKTGEGFINKYHFMRVNDDILNKLGWPTGKQVDVTFEVKDGALIVRKK